MSYCLSVSFTECMANGDLCYLQLIMYANIALEISANKICLRDYFCKISFTGMVWKKH